MQIEKAEVIPVDLNLQQPVRMAGFSEIEQITAVFVRFETKQGRDAWGCTIAHPEITGQTSYEAIRDCCKCANIVPDLHPTNIEYSLNKLTSLIDTKPAVFCAFDLAFHDLLGLAANMPLHRLLGGYRHKIQTSVTVPIASVQESVEIAKMRAGHGFRMLKIKGGLDPEEDIRRVRAISRALPDIILRLDPDGGYSVQQALDVARVLGERLEMLEQPTLADDLDGLRQVTRNSPVPVLADQSISDSASALELATHHNADGFSIKMANCGGFRAARQMDGIARAAALIMMVSCVIEPALLIAAGLSFALSSPNVRYADLDGHLDLVDDPTNAGFQIEDGWLIAGDVPGLGCMVEL